MGSGQQAGDLESDLKRFAGTLIDAIMSGRSHLQGILKEFPVPPETQAVEKTSVIGACFPDVPERKSPAVCIHCNGMGQGILSTSLPAVNAGHDLKGTRGIQPADNVVPFSITGYQ
jgi:hypothetical protein